MAPATKNTHTPHTAADINIYMSQGLEPTVILYQENQSTDLLLWDGNLYSISLFGIDNYLEGNIKNIT